MILILGGTTEGRKAVPSRRERWQTLLLLDGRQRTGDRSRSCHSPHRLVWTKKMLAQFCREKKISLLVDAAHPFAIRLHRTLAQRFTPVSGFRSSGWKGDTPHMTSGYDTNGARIMPPPSTAYVRTGSATYWRLTGVKTIAKLRLYWEQTRSAGSVS
ncbi:MAG: precorrin-6A/cobalt-precorrin-6A reductase [Parabacteroides merdae]